VVTTEDIRNLNECIVEVYFIDTVANLVLLSQKARSIMPSLYIGISGKDKFCAKIAPAEITMYGMDLFIAIPTGP